MADDVEGAAHVLTVNYIKASQFREISCDGVVGGQTAKSKIWMAFFSERYPLPRIVGYRGEEKPDDTEFVNVDETKEPVFFESRQGIIRNIEFGVYMDLQTAERTLKWLSERVDELRSAKS